MFVRDELASAKTRCSTTWATHSTAWPNPPLESAHGITSTQSHVIGNANRAKVCPIFSAPTCQVHSWLFLSARRATAAYVYARSASYQSSEYDASPTGLPILVDAVENAPSATS